MNTLKANVCPQTFHCQAGIMRSEPSRKPM